MPLQDYLQMQAPGRVALQVLFQFFDFLLELFSKQLMPVKVRGGEIPGKRAHLHSGSKAIGKINNTISKKLQPHLVVIALYQWAGEHFGIEVKRHKHINLSCVFTSNLGCSFPPPNFLTFRECALIAADLRLLLTKTKINGSFE